MRSNQHRRRINHDNHEYSHSSYTSIPEPDLEDTTTSRFATVLSIWLALLIAAALIGYSLQSLHSNPSNTPKQNVRQAPI
jgi:hypothetical protein